MGPLAGRCHLNVRLLSFGRSRLFSVWRASLFMNRFRVPTAALLLVSLVFSDLATFWHVGNCCDRSTIEVSQPANADSSSGNCHTAACQHDHNPFAARKMAADARRAPADENRAAEKSAADRLATSETSAAEGGCEGCPESTDAPHDDERCSLCRWLVTARDAAQSLSNAVQIERCAWIDSSLGDWVSPAHTPCFHELTRRGPPAAFCLS